MFEKFLIAAAVCVILTPMLYSDMPQMGGMGMGSQQMRSSSYNSGGQERKQATAVYVSTDGVNDILSFEDKLGLSGQQVISIHMIDADAKQDAAERSKTVQQCQKEYTKSLNQNTPDFAYIRSALKKLTDAQTDVQTVWVDAYEKAYAPLTDAQKTRLGFLRALRQQELDQKAEAAAREGKQPPPSPITSPSAK